jgi:hypothetical protein
LNIVVLSPQYDPPALKSRRPPDVFNLWRAAGQGEGGASLRHAVSRLTGRNAVALRLFVKGLADIARRSVEAAAPSDRHVHFIRGGPNPRATHTGALVTGTIFGTERIVVLAQMAKRVVGLSGPRQRRIDSRVLRERRPAARR